LGTMNDDDLEVWRERRESWSKADNIGLAENRIFLDEHELICLYSDKGKTPADVARVIGRTAEFVRRHWVPLWLAQRKMVSIDTPAPKRCSTSGPGAYVTSASPSSSLSSSPPSVAAGSGDEGGATAAATTTSITAAAAAAAAAAASPPSSPSLSPQSPKITTFNTKRKSQSLFTSPTNTKKRSKKELKWEEKLPFSGDDCHGDIDKFPDHEDPIAQKLVTEGKDVRIRRGKYPFRWINHYNNARPGHDYLHCNENV